MSFWKAVLGTRQQRRLARYERRVAAIGKLEPELRLLSDDVLGERAGALRERARGAPERGDNPEKLDDLLVEAFAVGREASRRTLGMRHFDVQLMGGMALHEGLIVEMKTGEGKTLVATLPAFLDAITGDGVHIVTVNDYLAQRDAEWMGPLYRMLGLSVGVILEEMEGDETEARKAAYACDVTYGTNHEIAFDYLRDNLAVDPEEIVHRGFSHAIIDEVDFLIIDEARTPLIISGPSHEDADVYDRVDRVTRSLHEGYHYVVEPKTRTANLTDVGIEAVQDGLSIELLTDLRNLELYHAVHQSILAHGVYHRDVDYIVEDARVFIVDEFTGRVSEDKRYADGLHQAIEAKERVEVRAEDRTLAKVTYQTFFGRYRKLSGMTGTAYTEREEFSKTYGRDVQVIPTHKPMIREDFADGIYDTLDDKHDAIIAEILELREKGRPVLVGSTSVRESERISRRLRQADVPHAVLNAKNHSAEAEVIAQAGRRGAVTISTNMAGRGTDIVLGGTGDDTNAPTVVAAGGLHVIGTAHHESVRIDDQLRGRAGRQGDPGSSQFIVSLDDEIWQKFGRADIEEIREALNGAQERGRPIELGWVERRLRGLQRKVDEENKAIRRDVLKYDLVIHAQRETIYGWRRTLVTGEGYDPEKLVREVVEDLGDESEDYAELMAALRALFHVDFDVPAERRGDLYGEVTQRALELLHRREREIGADVLNELGRQILLGSIDELWTDHLSALERLEEGIGLRGYAQVDPVIEWRREATEMWEQLLSMVRRRAVGLWFRVEVATDVEPELGPAPTPTEPTTRPKQTTRRG
jgi:preprotein translocase subunit SecA